MAETHTEPVVEPIEGLNTPLEDRRSSKTQSGIFGLGMPSGFGSLFNLRLFTNDLPSPKAETPPVLEEPAELQSPRPTLPAHQEGDLTIHEAETQYATVEDEQTNLRGSYAALSATDRPRLNLSTRLSKRPSESSSSPASWDPVTHQTIARIASDGHAVADGRARLSSALSTDGSLHASSDRSRQTSMTYSGAPQQQPTVAFQSPEPGQPLPNVPPTPNSASSPKSLLRKLGLKGFNRKASDLSPLKPAIPAVQITSDAPAESRPMSRQPSGSSMASNSTSRTAEYKRAPKIVRTRCKNKAERDFKHLFLAQTISVDSTLPVPSPPPSANTETTSSSASQPSLVDDRRSMDATGPPRIQKKPAIWTMEFSQCGRYLAAAGHDRVVRVWQVLIKTRMDHDATNGDAEGTERHRSSRRRSRAISMASQAPVFEQKPLWQYVGHTADVLDLSWSKNSFLLSSSMDKTVRLWHVSRSECLAVYQHSDFVTSVAFHPRDDRYFLSGSLDCRLRLWSVPGKNLFAWAEVDQLITAVAFSSDGTKCMAGTYMGQCAFFVTDGLKYASTLRVASSRGKNSKGSKITGIKAIPTSTPGHDRLLISTNDSRLRLYNLWNNSLEAKYSGHENTSSQIRAALSEEGHFIVSGSENGEAHVWDSGVAKESEASGWLLSKKAKAGLESFPVCSDIITCCAFAPEGTKDILAASYDPILGQASQGLTVDGVTRRSTALSSQVTRRTSDGTILDDKAFDETLRQNAITDAILACADQEGHIRIFRNSEFPTQDKRRMSLALNYANSKLREGSSNPL